MSFVVTVKGARLNAGYNLDTAPEAVQKAESCVALGKVTITDPHNEEWKPEGFERILSVWATLFQSD